MKWHQVGNGKVQLRLPIGVFFKDRTSYLCEAYIKQNIKQEQRQLAKFKVHLQKIRQNNYTECGRL